MTIADNIAEIRARIAEAATRSGRNPDAITLVGVTKTVEPARIVEAYAAGLRDFGENYVQESTGKTGDPRLSEFAQADGEKRLRWHFIGHLQSNKAREIIPHFDVVHSVDTLGLARELDRRAAQAGKTLDVLLQVKIDPVETKFGVAPEATPALAAQVLELKNVRLRGLMGMAPFGDTPEIARPAFATLRTLFDGLPPEARHTLSMGMSGDFTVAIEEGSTLIRIGTAIFGRRLP